MTISTDDLGRITQQTAVLTADGDKLGTINQIYTSDNTGDPAWVTLKTGMFGTKESFVPLGDASFDGDDLRVPVTKDAVHGAPRVDAGGHLSPDEEDELYRYYGLHNPDRPEADAAAGGLHEDRSDDDRPRRDDDRLGRADDRLGRADEALGDRSSGAGAHAAGAGAAAAAGAAGAVAGHEHDEQRSDREVVSSGSGEDEAVRPGERTTRLKRYVVTERVVQTVEELPDDPR